MGKIRAGRGIIVWGRVGGGRRVLGRGLRGLMRKMENFIYALQTMSSSSVILLYAI